MIIPNTDVNLDTEVRDTLNAAGGSVSNNTTSFFKAAAKLNPFSKHKPVILNTDFCQDFDKTRDDYYEKWWQGTNKDCGLTPCEVSHYSYIPEKMDGDMNGWVYNLPTGGKLQPLRIGDFCSYMTDALPPMYGFTVPSQVSNSKAGGTVTGMCALSTSNSNYYLTFADFPTFKDYYFGMYIKHKGSTQARYLTATKALGDMSDTGGIGDSSSSVSISSYGLPVGTWEAYPFICSVKQDGITEVVGKYYTLPKNDMVTFEVVNTMMVINVRAKYNYINGVKRSVSIESIKITSYDGSITLTNNVMKLRFAENAVGDPMYDGEKTINLPDVSVPANEEYSVPLNAIQNLISLSPNYTDKEYYLYLTFDTEAYTSKAMIAQEVTDKY